jgi:hypothetical protein
MPRSSVLSLQEKLTSLKLPAIGRPAEEEEQERLLKLFWNRAELKKELQELDDQLHNLRNKLKQQESANARLQEQQEHLEAILGRPARAPDALVHFALRGLWRTCRNQLEQLADDLRRQRQDKERKRQLAEFQADRAERLKIAAARLAEVEGVAATERARLEEGERRLARLTGFWNYFRRRELAFELVAQRERVAASARHLDDMREALRTLEKEPWPEFAGLSIEGRRVINLTVIAHAQLLYERLAPAGLAAQARLAMNRGVEEARFGSRQDCLNRLDEIERATKGLESPEGMAAQLRDRAEKIRAAVGWRSRDDVVPTPATVPPSASGSANVLLDDYWDVYRILLR